MRAFMPVLALPFAALWVSTAMAQDGAPPAGAPTAPGEGLPPLDGAAGGQPEVLPPGSALPSAPATQAGPTGERGSGEATILPPGSALPSEPAANAGPTGLAGQAPADASNGVIVRLRSDAPLSGPVEVSLTGGGEAFSLPMNDAGTPPDVSAGDGVWAAVVPSAPLELDVSLSVAGKMYAGGRVTWGPDDQPRDLDLQISGDKLSVNAHTQVASQGPETSALTPGDPNALPPVNNGVVPGENPGGKSAAGQGGGTASSSAPLPPLGPTAEEGPPPVFWVVSGALLTGIIGFAVMAWRGRAMRGTIEVAGLPPMVPEAGVFGPGTPSLSDGLSVWLCDDVASALPGVLATVADGRQVVLVAPASLTVPPVLGGPVYRARSVRPPAIVDAVLALQANSGAPVAVVVVGVDAKKELIDDILDALPRGVGGVVLDRAGAEIGEHPLVRLGRAADGWVAEAGNRQVILRETSRGFVAA